MGIDLVIAGTPKLGITNPNLNILGTSGGGKSFASKVLLLREYALGARILILDPEQEYRRICRGWTGPGSTPPAAVAGSTRCRYGQYLTRQWTRKTMKGWTRLQQCAARWQLTCSG